MILQLGIVPVSAVARRLWENRVTVYSVLKSLKAKWVVYETKKKATTFYWAISPQQLADQQEAKLELFKKKIPEMEALMNTTGIRPKMQFFEGEEWLMQMYYDILSSEWDDLRSFFSLKHFDEALSKRVFETFVPLRVKAWITAKIIMQWDPDDTWYIEKSNEVSLKEVLIIKDELFNLQCQIDIYGLSKVAIILSAENELVWVIIESEKVYQTLRSIFELIWKTHKK